MTKIQNSKPTMGLNIGIWDFSVIGSLQFDVLQYSINPILLYPVALPVDC